MQFVLQISTSIRYIFSKNDAYSMQLLLIETINFDNTIRCFKDVYATNAKIIEIHLFLIILASLLVKFYFLKLCSALIPKKITNNGLSLTEAYIPLIYFKTLSDTVYY